MHDRTGRPSLGIWRLALPATATQFSLTLAHLVDTIFLGRLGPQAIGGAGLVGTLLFNINAIGMGLGLTACMARMVGAGRPEEAALFYRSGLILAAGVGALLVPPLLAVARPLFGLIGTPEVLLEPAEAYYRAIMGFTPFFLLMAALGAAFRATGDSRTPMMAGVAANVLNVALDWLLIFGKLRLSHVLAYGGRLWPQGSRSLSEASSCSFAPPPGPGGGGGPSAHSPSPTCAGSCM